MKKQICILVAAMLLLTGCQFSAKPQQQVVPEFTLPVPQETTIPVSDPTEETPSVQYTQKQMIAVSMTPEYDYLRDEQNNVIFRFTKQDITLSGPTENVSALITEDFENRLDEYKILADDFRMNAESQYNQYDDWATHYYDVYYSPTRIDREVLSLSGNIFSYTGGRPTQVNSAINYSVLTGEVLTLGSILNHIDAKDDLVKLVTQQAAVQMEQLQLFDDYADCIADRFDREESFDEDWYFTEKGLCFYFTPYEIAPYTSGTVLLEIPYGQLGGIIDDDFFPPEEEIMIGSICAQQLSEADLSGYTQLAEVDVDSIGEPFFLFVDGAISDIQIMRGYWDEDGTEFTPEYTIFACNSLTPGDGIILQADIPDTMPNLCIQYRSGNENITVFLSQSGMDASAILIS